MIVILCDTNRNLGYNHSDGEPDNNSKLAYFGWGLIAALP